MAQASGIMFRLVFENAFLVHRNGVSLQPTTLSCSLQCTKNCASFFYNNMTKQCIISKRCYLSSNPRLKSEDGWRFYQTTGVVCPATYRHVPSVGMCVKFALQSAQFSAATAVCETQTGGRLIHLDTSAKIAAIEAIIRHKYSYRSFYIGLSDESTSTRGEFRWADGTPVTDHNFDLGQPENKSFPNCIVIAHWRQYKWVALSCNLKVQYICEIA